jgi:hypothetical protein
MHPKIGAIILLVTGTIFVLKPAIFQRWFWKQTDIAQRLLSPGAYLRYMRFVGAVNILVGSGMLLWSCFR